jgi:hypothetical protein
MRNAQLRIADSGMCKLLLGVTGPAAAGAFTAFPITNHHSLVTNHVPPKRARPLENQLAKPAVRL